jgi:hypothetical protein
MIKSKTLINMQKCLWAKMPKLSKKCLKATNAEKKQKCLEAKNTPTCKNAYGQQMPKLNKKC